jgi:mono/diheme cytochrome c family protein
VKKKIQFWFLLLLFAAAVLSAYIEFADTPVYKTQTPSLSIEITANRLAEGKRMAQTICFRCHYNYETQTLAGRQHGNPKRLGDFSSGNITRDSVTGIGAWSSGQLYYFLRTGIKPNGEYVFDMPKYPNLCEEDLLSIVAFFESDDSLVRKTNCPNPTPRFSFLTKLLLHTLIRPPVYDSKKVLYPDTNNPIVFGKYLATAKYSCYECHSLNMVTTNYNTPEKSWGFFKGGNPHVNEAREKIYTPNITADTLKGIGKWSEEEFVRSVKNGIKPDGTNIRDPMFPFYLLSDKEVKNIYAYLKTLTTSDKK